MTKYETNGCAVYFYGARRNCPECEKPPSKHPEPKTIKKRTGKK